MISTELSIVIASLLLSAFFSGSEIAYVSTNRLRIEIKGKKEGIISSILALFVKKPSHFITTLLIGNNIAMVIYGIFFSSLIFNFWSDNGLYGQDNAVVMFLLQTVLASLVVLIVGEFVPKALCSLSPFKTLTIFALPLVLFYYALLVFVEFTVWLSRILLKYVLRVDLNDDDDGYDRVDLFYMLNENNTVEETQDSEVDTEIFKNALEFAHTKIRDCMVPRPEIDAVEIDDSLETVKEAFFETGRSKLVVYKENIDNVLGYIHSIDLFNNPKTVKSMIIPVPFASESTPASEMLRELIDRRRSMAQVVDEFGGTAGIVTVEDLIEEIFGEIEDEYDTEGLTEQQLSEREFVFSARQEISYLNDKYEFDIEEGEYDTLGGFIIHDHQNIPEEGETIIIGPFTFIILSMEGAKIQDVKLILSPKHD